MSQRRKLAALLSADVVGYSRLMGDDEQGTLSTLKAYREIFAQHIVVHDGRVVDSPGDALLAEFPSAVEAVKCAVDIQRELAGRNASLPEHRRMCFRIGVNLGDVTEQDGALYGDGVNIAARLESLAEPGGICVSGTIYDQVEGKSAVAFAFAGEQSVKNIAKPVRVYRADLEIAGQRVRTASRVHSTRSVALVAVLLAAVIVIAVIEWHSGTLRTTKKHASKDDSVLAMPTSPSIAVLPFQNLTGDPKRDYIVDGITEQLITALTRFRDLFVIARNSTFKYKSQAVDVRQVGRDLGARYVLEGSIRQAGQTIRVTAQLLDASSGATLWAENYERKLTAANILGLQDDISERVVGAIAGGQGVVSRATVEQAKAKATDSLDAYNCVLRWYDYQRSSIGPQEHLRVRECLEQAVKLDPNYADAWAMLSWVYVEEHQQGFNPRPNSLDRALEAARRAIELAPTHQRSFETLANVYFFKGDLDAFFPLAERTVELNPNSSNTLAEMGNFIFLSRWTDSTKRERGVAMVKKAMALNPAYPDWYHFPMAWNHWWKGEHDMALAEAKRINLPDYFWTHMLQAVIYGAMGKKTEAGPVIANLLRLYPDIPQKIRAEWRKWNIPNEVIDRAIEDLRRAGMDIPTDT